MQPTTTSALLSSALTTWHSLNWPTGPELVCLLVKALQRSGKVIVGCIGGLGVWLIATATTTAIAIVV